MRIQDIFGIVSDVAKSLTSPGGAGMGVGPSTGRTPNVSPHAINFTASFGHYNWWSIAFSEYRAIPRLVPTVAEGLGIVAALVLPRVFIKVRDKARRRGIARLLQGIFYNLMANQQKSFHDLLYHLLQDGNLILAKDPTYADRWVWIDPAFASIFLVVKDETHKHQIKRAFEQKRPLMVPFKKVYVIRPHLDFIVGPAMLTGWGEGVRPYQATNLNEMTFGYGSSLNIVTEQELNRIRETAIVYSEDDVVHVVWEMGEYFPYGTSLLENARYVWKQYMVLIQSLIIFRLAHAFKRDVVYFPTGDLNPFEAQDRVNQMIENLFGDWITWGGEFLRTGKLVGPMSPVVIPYAEGYKPEIQPGESPPQRFREIDDVKFFLNQLLAGIHLQDIFNSDTLKFMTVDDIRRNQPAHLLALTLRLANLVHLLVESLIRKTTDFGLEGADFVITRVDTVFSKTGENYPTMFEVLPEEMDEKTEEDEIGGIGIGGIGQTGGVVGVPLEEAGEEVGGGPEGTGGEEVGPGPEAE